MACALGMVLIEKHIVEALIGARLAQAVSLDTVVFANWLLVDPARAGSAPGRTVMIPSRCARA